MLLSLLTDSFGQSKKTSQLPAEVTGSECLESTRASMPGKVHKEIVHSEAESRCWSSGLQESAEHSLAKRTSVTFGSAHLASYSPLNLFLYVVHL